MKTIKLLSFMIFLSLALASCEDRTKVRVEDNREPQATVDDDYTTSKTNLEKSIIDLRTRLDAQIAEYEREFGTASDDRKAEITVKLDESRKRKSDLERLADRIANATAEGWRDLERETNEVLNDIKDALD